MEERKQDAAKAPGTPGRQAQGKPAAGSERPSPTSTNVEADYWRSNYQHRPYVEPGVSYDQYAPAYRYGGEMYSIHAPSGRSFEDLEPELGRHWERARDPSILAWDKARPAAEDAWRRMETTRRAGGEPSAPSPEATGKILRLFHLCNDGAEGMREAAGKVGPAHASLLNRLAEERAAIACELRGLAQAGGADIKPTDDSLGTIRRGWAGPAGALGGGPDAILRGCEREEEAVVRAFQDALNESGVFPEDVEAALNRQYTRINNAYHEVRAITQNVQEQ